MLGDEKNLEYYLSLKYPLSIRPLSEEDGGYYAVYPDFGGATAHGDGESIEEAIKEANLSKRLTLESLFEHGDPVPQPGALESYSGKFNVRVPKSLHRQLALEAEREGVSLNMLIVSR
ncbi:MAG: toxin-antitoxin system HicB family antitoxin, partial [Deinococcota bacterium]|nr:toxin-antitoxin system HicB family antitoxin [Deinococcota bacterium]